MTPAPDLLWWKTLCALLAAGFGALALFVALPSLDLAAARLFHAPREGFPLGRVATTSALRELYHLAFVAALALSLTGLAARLVAPRVSRTPLAVWLFTPLLAIVGPGLLVNALLKERWGRARPQDVEAFGGGELFTLPFQIAQGCATNCSFVSGEGAAAATVATAAVALFGAIVPRRRMAASLVVWGAGAAFIRMAPGKHFLSDMLFAFVLVGLVGALLYVALDVGAARRRMRPADLLLDPLRAALVLRRRLVPSRRRA